MVEHKNSLNSLDSVGEKTLGRISKANRFNSWMYSEIRPHIKGNLLEIGAGIGNISKFIIAEGLNVVLSDYNIEYCDLLKNKFLSNTNCKGILQIDLLASDFENRFIFLKEKFDTIILLNVIEHLEDDERAIANCRFMLKPDGHFIVLAPAYQWLYCNFDKQLGHYRRYTKKKLRSVIKKEGFKITSAQYFNFLGIAGWFLFGKIFKKKTIGKEMNSFDALVSFAKFLDRIVFKKIGLSTIVIGKKESI